MRALLLVLALLLGVAPAAAAPVRHYVLAIGNNALPAAGAEPGLAPLRYADDDAAAFYQFALGFADEAVLLSVLDAASQRRFPEAAAAARPPTLAELRQTVAWLARRIAADRAQGASADVIFFFSGHGTGGDAPALALLDGPLDHTVLYEEVLAALPARFVHLFIDACHAETVVRPRDASAEVVEVSEEKARRFLARETLARFPHVGAIFATTASDQTHEWDAWQAGVFTHELLSGLRGGADVNGDRRIEYSELHAFLVAANREVRDARVRQGIDVRVPPLDLRVPIVELGAARGGGWAQAAPSGAAFHIDDERGERLVDAHAEPGHRMAFLLPLGRRLYLSGEQGEAEFQVDARRPVDLGRLKRQPPALTARGALGEAMRRGLFVTPYGPLYYRGFVDREGGLSVTFTPAEPPRAPRRPGGRFAAGVSLFALSGAAFVATAAAGGLALAARQEFDSTDLERPAAEASRRHEVTTTTAFIGLGLGAATALVGALVFPWRRGPPPTIAAGPDGVSVGWGGRF